MSEIKSSDPAQEGSSKKKLGLIQQFGSLPGGVQRIIIAVLVIVLLVALMFLRDMISTEEVARKNEES
jgi:hypothetical protein